MYSCIGFTVHRVEGVLILYNFDIERWRYGVKRACRRALEVSWLSESI